MAMWILVGMVAAIVFGLPMLPGLVVGALAMCGLSFVLTRDKRIARAGLGFGIILFNHFMTQGSMNTPGLPVPSWASWLASDDLLAVVSCVMIVWTMFLGIFGPIQHPTCDMTGVIKMVKDRENGGGDTDKTQ